MKKILSMSIVIVGILGFMFLYNNLSAQDVNNPNYHHKETKITIKIKVHHIKDSTHVKHDSTYNTVQHHNHKYHKQDTDKHSPDY